MILSFVEFPTLHRFRSVGACELASGEYDVAGMPYDSHTRAISGGMVVVCAQSERFPVFIFTPSWSASSKAPSVRRTGARCH
jgi:hypothetical protein